jgi:hypothetical protein
MKKYITYSLAILLLFLLLYWINQDVPIQYQWIPTFSTNDKQPYGAYAFDRILKATWKEGYTTNYQRISDLLPDGYDGDYDGDITFNLLIISDAVKIDEYESEQLFNFVENGGGNALIIANKISYFSIKEEKQAQSFSKVRIHTPEKEKIYTIPPDLCSGHIVGDFVDFAELPPAYILSETTDEQTLSIHYRSAKGSLIIACNPLLYTNYGILNDSINEYIRYHLSYLQGRPLIRTEYYHAGSQGAQSRSEFRYLLSQRPLKWAFYLTLATVLIFMVFTAKRKQRPIPVIKPPANKKLAFVRSVAHLYLRKNNNASIVSQKYTYWTDKLKRKYGIDIINENHDAKLYARIASKTGQPITEVRYLLIHSRAIEADTVLTDSEMMELIEKMNKLK